MRAGEAHAAMRALPLATINTLLQGRLPVILAPHPDDESIGCGGLLTALTQAGIQPTVVFVTDGTGSHPHSPSTPAPALAALRAQEARDAHQPARRGRGPTAFPGLARHRRPA